MPGKKLKTKKGVTKHETGSGGFSAYSKEETVAFTDFINNEFKETKEVKHLLPIKSDEEFFKSFGDGILLCKMINKVKPDDKPIDERVINKITKKQPTLNPWKMNENLNLAINSAKGIGCKVVSVQPEFLIEGRSNIVLGLVWQIIKMSLVVKVNLKHHPELVRLLKEGEELSDLLKLPPDNILLRWFNYQLEQAGHERRVKNFTSDIKDSECYTIVLNQISPKDKKCSKSPLEEKDPKKRAELMLKEAEKIDCRKFVSPKDVVKGHPKLNFAFVANMFNEYPALDPVNEEEYDFAELLDFDSEGSREERAFRFWIQSLGLDCNNLFDDMKDGILMLKVLDKIQKGCVNWKKVDKKPKMKIHKLVNTGYAVEVSKQLGVKVVGIDGTDIHDGNQKLILAMVWQQMRLSLLNVLKELGGGKKVDDKTVLKWANSKVEGKKIKSFKDKSMKNGQFLCRLCAAISPKSVDLEMIKEGTEDQDYEMNAKYAISVARKIGATVFLLWEDIVEVKPKMILSFIASLMQIDLKNSK